MEPKFMVKRKPAVVKLTRLEAQTKVINGMSRIAFIALCAAVGFVVLATAFPQKRKLEDLENRLLAAKERETAALAEREYHMTEHRALREDPSFLEIHARDRLDYYRPGEKVLKFKRQ